MTKKQTEILSVSSDGTINHWSTSNGKSNHTFTMDNNSLTCCDFTNDGRYYVVAGEDKTIYLFDEQTRKLITGLKETNLKNDGHKNKIFSVKTHHEDSNIVVSGGWDR
jgi:WD40 repeat protein